MNKSSLISSFNMQTKVVFFISTMLILLLYSVCSSRVGTGMIEPGEQTYTVSFNTNGGSEVRPREVNSGYPVARPDNPIRTNYTFGNWFTDEALTNIYSFSALVRSNLTLYAQWIPENATTYEVTFNTNGGSEVPEKEVNSGEPVARPDNPIRTNYTFGNWFRDEALTSIYTFSTPVRSNLTLYAQWIPENATTYEVTFNTNGGNTLNTQTIVEGDTAKKPDDPTRDDYKFLNWYSDPNAPSTAYDFGTVVRANITIYANWQRVFTVTFDANGGNLNGSEQVTQQTNADNTVNEPNRNQLTRAGHRFAGWYDNANGNGDAYNFDTKLTENKTLYAQWTPNQRAVAPPVDPATFNVTFDPNGDGDQVNLKGIQTRVVVNSGSPVARPDNPNDANTQPTRDGYRFVGWFGNSRGTGTAYNFNTNITENTTFYAKWQRVFTVTFDPNGDGDQVDLRGIRTPVVVNSGSPVARPDNPNDANTQPTRAGHDFAGWYDNAEGDGSAYNFNTNITRNTTLYAKWTPNQRAVAPPVDPATFNVTFNTNTSSVIRPQTLDAGERINMEVPGFQNLQSPSGVIPRTGATWYREATFENPFDLGNPVNSDLNLYAKWEYMVTYDVDTRTITGLNPDLTGESIDLFIPSNINGVRMDRIGDRAFENNTRIVSLSIAEGIRHIGQAAFRFGFNVNLFTSITTSRIAGNLRIPNSVVFIGDLAFYNCHALTSLTIGIGGESSLKTIGNWAFYRCASLTGDLTIPNSVETIGSSAFRNCSGLERLIIGSSVETIGASAFRNCWELTGSITIPMSVNTIGDLAFLAVANARATEADINTNVIFIFESIEPPKMGPLTPFSRYFTPFVPLIKVPAGAEVAYKSAFFLKSGNAENVNPENPYGARPDRPDRPVLVNGNPMP